MSIYEVQTDGLLEMYIKRLWSKRFARHHMEMMEVPPMEVVKLPASLVHGNPGMRDFVHPIETPLEPGKIFESLSGGDTGYLERRTCTTPLECHQTTWGVTMLVGVCEHGKIFVYRSDKQ